MEAIEIPTERLLQALEGLTGERMVNVRRLVIHCRADDATAMIQLERCDKTDYERDIEELTEKGQQG